MASAKILQRAETAMEIAGDFLFAEDDADDDSENCGENADTEDGEDAKSNASAREEPEGEQKEDEARENTANSEANQDGQTKKSEKGMGKKLKSLMGVAMRPFGSKLQWKLDFNFEASNKGSKRNDGKRNAKSNVDKTTGEQKSSRTSNDDDRKPSSMDASEIKRLRMENKRLEKLADKFLDAYIQLKTKIGELSEVEGQLKATRSNYDKLKEELKESQSNRESLVATMSKKSEEHRVAVNRLEAELKNAAKDVAMLQQDKKSISDKDKQNVANLQLTRKELETMTSIREKLQAELSKQEEVHRSETKRLIENLERAEKEKNDSAVQYREAIDMFKRATADLEQRATKAETDNVRLQGEKSELENERATLRTNLNASMAKVNELRRAIAVLESNPSTSTTVGTANKGLFSCPLCGQEFGSLANMQLHAEDCCT